jgi:3-methylornithyl-N6-L-lysine dehydrogenase
VKIKMALLTPEDPINIDRQLQEADSTVRRVTGFDIKGVCGTLYGTSPCHEKIGIMPVTSGNGVIGNFSASLQAITQYFGFESFVTGTSDVSGYYEAVRNGAEIILMADDYTLVVSLNYRTIPKKRVHPTHLMNILGDSCAFGFQ